MIYMRQGKQFRKEVRRLHNYVPNLQRRMTLRLKEAGITINEPNVNPVRPINFSGIAKTVKRVIGLNAPVVFADNPAAFYLLLGKKNLPKLIEAYKKAQPKKRLSLTNGQALRFALYDMKIRHGAGVCIKGPDGKWIIYVDKEALHTLGHLGVDVRTPQETTARINSVVAHEVAQAMYNEEQLRRGREPSEAIGEIIGRFFEFDYLTKKSPALAERFIGTYIETQGNRLTSIMGSSEAHTQASLLITEIFGKIQNSQRRREIMRQLAKSDLQTIENARQFIFQRLRA